MDTRSDWIDRLTTLASPVLDHAARGRLHAAMPVVGGDAQREEHSHLEAVGRLFAGLAPWLACPLDASDPERERRDAIRDRARAALVAITDPASPDRCNFASGQQPVVDAAFLAHALVRAPHALIDALSAGERDHLRDALGATRAIRPHFNNWLLFSAMVEVALERLDVAADPMRIDYALRQHEQWYCGDGVYGDGPAYHCDYYNSYVIQPMLLAIADAAVDRYPEWSTLAGWIRDRAPRYAAIQERSVGPDGSFPAIGRSLAYRCGAFQHLADCALRGILGDDLAPAQVRGALGAVIARTLDAPGTYDAQGWLQIGLCGHQPALGEPYISTGSLYLAATAFLPLGLPGADPFWADPAAPWTARRVWELHEDIARDHAIHH